MTGFPLFQFLRDLQAVNKSFTITAEVNYPKSDKVNANQAEAIIIVKKPDGTGQSFGKEFSVDVIDLVQLTENFATDIKDVIPEIVLP